MSLESSRKPNRLIKEKSPYLLKHAYNPVDWYTWTDEALSKAKNDGKPIFLSIGYSTCHWCSVMERESFEDPKTADLINRNFIPIKVDREERPELDTYYMNAVQSMTGQGGWPLTVFLTPDLKPFYGGTYFPPEPKYGMPSFTQVLEFVSKAWKDDRAKITESASQVAVSIEASFAKAPEGAISPALLDAGNEALLAVFDPEYGGFGRAPKFPMPTYASFLLRYNFRTGREMSLKAVEKTLEEIAQGGIHDHVGGGFHRYATDRVWLVPHFEKMLYDNALLSKLFLEAFQVTKKPEFASAAKDTLGWLLKEMLSPEGGFFSAQDADTAEGEGVYYTWTPEEVARVLGTSEGAAFSSLFGVTKNGNFEGSRSVLSLGHSQMRGSDTLGGGPVATAETIDSWKRRLYEARLSRPRPATDRKILTSWNSLAISTFVKAWEVFEEVGYLDTAVKCAQFISNNLWDGKSLLRRFADGEAAIEGTLEDYASLVEALLDLFEATGKGEWLELALAVNDSMSGEFRDAAGGGFFMNRGGAPARIKESYDGPTPSGNSVAAKNLVRLGELTGRDEFKVEAKRIFEAFAGSMEDQPTAHTNLLAALDLYLKGMREVVVTGRDAPAAEPFAREFRRRFLPDKVLVVAVRENAAELGRLTPLLEGRNIDSPPTVYVCQNYACKAPVRGLDELKAQLDSVS